MIIIRHSHENDTEQLEKLFLITQQAAFTWREPTEFKIGDFVQSTKGEEVWVAEIANKIVGFVSIWFDKNNFIHNLFVHPDYQGQGIGTLLLNKAIERSFGVDYIELKVEVNNTHACMFYKKRGWIKISTHHDEEPGSYHLLRFEKKGSY